MTQLAIETLLKQKIGLDSSTLGSETMKRAILQCMADCGLTDMQAYLTQLQTSTQELEQLIETVIVPESWFFRDKEPFVFLSNYVMSEWKTRDRVLRLLSLPCSTGEEPYSIAIALQEAGLTAKSFCIDAVDISKKSLLKARQAIYSRNSFRGNNLVGREHYFTQIGEQYQLCESIKSTVNFIYGNLLDPYLLIDKIPYDVIFCRNVLIYFDILAKEQSVQVLSRLLIDKGLLFMGHSETQLLTSQFVAVQHPLAFAYQKQEYKNQKLRNEEKSTKSKEPTQIKRHQKLNSKPEIKITSNPLSKMSQEVKTIELSQKKDETTTTPTLILINAQNLADQGQLHQALSLCETYLKQNPTSAEAYLLLGQIFQVKGNEEQAEQYFQKAIYLEPNYYEALIHLALLKERCGDIAKAAVIRQRIQRIQNIS